MSDEKTEENVQVITDAKGRKLKIHEVSILEESRLVRALGSDVAMNSAYMMGYVLPAVMVCEIDGNAIPFPATLAQTESLIGRLGKEGIQAVLEHQMAEAGEGGEGQKEAAGN